jgi:4-hydroxybenzoyl-CoA thioesterase
MLTNIRSTRVEWCDCDPAGIIFYPRYFDMFETSTTVLIERALGMAKIDYLEAYDLIGHPAVEARARFRFPTRFGDDVSIATTLTAVEQSRFTLEHRVTKAGALAVEGFETREWVGRDAADPARLVSRPIPPDVLARFKQGVPA